MQVPTLTEMIVTKYGNAIVHQLNKLSPEILEGMLESMSTKLNARCPVDECITMITTIRKSNKRRRKQHVTEATMVLSFEVYGAPFKTHRECIEYAVTNFRAKVQNVVWCSWLAPAGLQTSRLDFWCDKIKCNFQGYSNSWANPNMDFASLMILREFVLQGRRMLPLKHPYDRVQMAKELKQLSLNSLEQFKAQHVFEDPKYLSESCSNLSEVEDKYSRSKKATAERYDRLFFEIERDLVASYVWARQCHYREYGAAIEHVQECIEEMQWVRVIYLDLSVW